MGRKGISNNDFFLGVELERGIFLKELEGRLEAGAGRVGWGSAF